MTKPEIKVDEWITGPQGMWFELYPIRGVHPQSDIELIKEQLYRDRDVVQIKTTWLKENAKGQDK